MSAAIPSHHDLLAVRPRIHYLIHRTPVLTSRLLDSISGAQLFFKCENFQRMGAFKMRGASHALSMLTNEEKACGVITHSSGNFAQALSLAAQSLGVKAYIVMPQNAPAVKKAAVRDYQGNIIESGNTPAEREAKAEEVRTETGATFVHPSNDLNVILGNATAAQELIEDVPDIDIIIAPVGGGGLVAGTCLAAQHLKSKISVIGAEPSGADDAYRSLRDGVIYPSENPKTICDGLRTNFGNVNFPVIRALLSEILRVDDTDTIHAMKLIFERMKIVVEPSSAITLAAILANSQVFTGKRIGLILSGGNVDLAGLGDLFRG